MKKTTRLKNLINDDKLLVMPGVYDALSARIAEEVGFEAIQISGYGTSASYLGMTDASLISLGDVFTLTKNIANIVDIPVMADADTGFGNAVNVSWTVNQLEIAGAAGVNIEDQTFPKRCGHMEGKSLITLEEMVGKIRAAVESRKDTDFVINARTDAISVIGVEEAIKRGNAYAEAGADLIFMESPPTIEIIKKVINEVNAPVSINMLEGGQTPRLTFSELEELGAARVSCPMTTTFAAAENVKKSLMYLKEKETSVGYEDLMPFTELQNITDTPKIREMEKRYSW